MNSNLPSDTRRETAFFFANEGRRLFAMAHRPVSDSAEFGVVLCHPFGEEKQFSHRILVILARRLAKAGIPTLRFDCRGYGDSEGELEDVTLTSHKSDTLEALRVARAELGLRRIALVGLRLGADVAALVSEGEVEISGLALWAPITDGASFANELYRKALLGQLVSKNGPRSRQQLEQQLAEQGFIEVEGQTISTLFLEELQTLDLTSIVKNYHNPVLLALVRRPKASDQDRGALSSLYENIGAPVTEMEPVGEVFWDDRSLYGSSFPDSLCDETVRWAKTLSEIDPC